MVVAIDASAAQAHRVTRCSTAGAPVEPILERCACHVVVSALRAWIPVSCSSHLAGQARLRTGLDSFIILTHPPCRPPSLLLVPYLRRHPPHAPYPARPLLALPHPVFTAHISPLSTPAKSCRRDNISESASRPAQLPPLPLDLQRGVLLSRWSPSVATGGARAAS